MPKLTVEECFTLDTVYLGEKGAFRPEEWEAEAVWNYGIDDHRVLEMKVDKNNTRIAFLYTVPDPNTGTLHTHDYLLQIMNTPCHYGGERYWFRCFRCEERVRTIHLRSMFYGEKFCCRKCQNLSYQVQGLWGWEKQIGKRLKTAELEDLHVKRCFGTLRRKYRGIPTKGYKRFKKYEERENLFWETADKLCGEGRLIRKKC